VSSFPVVRGKRARFTQLDECGNLAENGLYVVTAGFISIGLAAETETGDDIVLKNANGDLCVSDKSQDQFKRWNLTMSFCEVDPCSLSLTSNTVLEEDWDNDPVGVRGYQGANPARFALEVWTGVPGADCVPGEATQYGYLLLPFVVPGVLADFTIENGAATFGIGGFTRGAGGWGKGPWDVVPADAQNTPGPLTTDLTDIQHHLLRRTTVAPPEVTDGCQEAPAAT
jgi:hypothetical protein